MKNDSWLKKKIELNPNFVWLESKNPTRVEEIANLSLQVVVISLFYSFARQQWFQVN